MKPIILGTTILPFIIAVTTGGFNYNTQSPSSPEGKPVFEKKCQRCHGSDGTKGMFGAKDLQASRLNDTELFTVISEGRRIMPSWKRTLTQEQINAVIVYVKSLRKN